VGGNFDLNPQQKWAAPAEGFKRSNLAVALTGNFSSYFAGKSVPPVKEPPAGASDSLKQIMLSSGTADQNRTIVARNKGRHLVLIGDSDFLTGQFAMPGNVTLLLNIADWLSTDENLITIRSRTMVDRSISKDNLKEGSSKSNVVRFINILLMPLLVVLTGLFIFFKRREASAAAPVSTEKTEEKAS
jgi:ABC-2 type transport system permease protein